MLPKYCKPCIIKQHMSNSDADIFNVTINDNIIRFEISSRYIAKKQKQILLEENIDRLKSFINDFNTVILTLTQVIFHLYVLENLLI